jgi:beta-mannosidase
MAFWAIKRESQQITVGLKRTELRFEAWGVNMSLEDLVVDVQVKMFDVRSGRILHEQVLLQNFSLVANRSTEFPSFSLPEATESKAVVAAIYLVQKGAVLGRHVNFHEPLKEVPFQSSNHLNSMLVSRGQETWLQLDATVPVKGVMVEAKGPHADEVVWDENGVDLVPGETMRLPVKGLKHGDEDRLKISWLGSQLL